MAKVIELDSYQTLEALFKRDYNSEKFAISVFHPNNDVATYISGGMNDMEICYLIQCLKDRRDYIFKDE